ncbi:LINE-1 reverse transcriptase-like protein [Frankliniella fusca]|uniref:LINE-1 reverse transcriptase-like protein n=1 Tax=Frankliniella fusca TaxID=407009 RepID=A0AAE1HBE3_9NEOP|nr:LINE-1 reverse transcriptase-like protein [Frankliniella fusca]
MLLGSAIQPPQATRGYTRLGLPAVYRQSSLWRQVLFYNNITCKATTLLLRNNKSCLPTTKVVRQQQKVSETATERNVLQNHGTQSIGHINVNSLRNKCAEMEVIMKIMHLKILCVSEHWVHHNEKHTISLNGYECAVMQCRENTLHGGTAIFTENNLKFKVFPLQEYIVDCVFEAVAIICDKYSVICVYRPPDGNSDLFFERLNEVVNILISKRQYIFICGDFNIDLRNNDYRKHSLKRNMLDFMEQYGLHTTTDKPTRVCNNTKSSIDHILTNMPEEIYSSRCDVEVGLSDHTLQYISWNKKKNENVKPYMYRRKITDSKIFKFSLSIERKVGNSLDKSASVDKNFKSFHEKYQAAYESDFPLQKVKSSCIEKTWVTPCIKNTSNNYRKLCKQFKETNDEDFKKYFQAYRKCYRKVINSAKQQAILREIRESENKSKTIWKIINKNIGKSAKKPENIKIKDDNGNLIDDPREVVSNFNRYYVSIPNKLKEDCSGEGTTSKQEAPQTMYLSPATITDVHRAINKLSNKKCCGWDEICDVVFKKSSYRIVEHLESFQTA